MSETPPNRITVVEHVYYEDRQGGAPIIPAGKPYSTTVESDELPFQRKLKAGSEWQGMPGVIEWLGGSVGLLKIENVEGENLQVTPTEEEKADIASRIIDVGVKTETGVQPFGEVRPGESLRINVHLDALILVRCRIKTAKYWIHAFPR